MGVFGLALLLVASASVHAKSTTMSFTTSYAFAPAGPPARAWVDDEGVQHVRGQPYSGTFSGGLTGPFTFVLNVNVDPTGSGDIFGTVHIEVAQGTFDGRFSADLTGGLSHGTFVAQSEDGLKMMGEFQDTAPGAGGIEGVILSPHG